MTTLDADRCACGCTDAPCFVDALRQLGRQRFDELGWPTRRDESWRYTDVSPIANTQWREPGDALPADVYPADVARFAIPDLDAVTLVFVDGVFRPELSDDASDLGAGVTCTLLPEAVRERASWLDGRIGTLTSETDDAFTAMSNARAGELGVVLHANAGARAAKPVRVLSIASDPTPVAAHPRHVIIAGKGAGVTFIEHSVCLADDAVSFTNAVTEVFADDGAKVEHYFLEQDSERAFNVSTLAIRQGASSDVHSHTILLGGRLVRNNVMPTLIGEDAHCLINGLYVGQGRQHLDNAMRVRHAAPNCRSRQHYKGIMNDRSRGVFTGRIIVDPVAQQTDAIQSNRNMLLSDDARINARPQLEIYADDVRCTHGCTTGRVDDELVFYFRSRGIPENVSRAMLIYAFAAEGFERMSLKPVRRLLAAEMIAKLPGAQGLSIELD